MSSFVLRKVCVALARGGYLFPDSFQAGSSPQSAAYDLLHNVLWQLTAVIRLHMYTPTAIEVNPKLEGH